MAGIRLLEAIETERLVLRRWTMDDALALYEAVDGSRERVGAWLPWVRYYTGPAAAETFLQTAEQQWLAGDELPLAVTERGSGRILGGAGFHGRRFGEPIRGDHGAIETGYWLRDGEEGKGYMREAVRAEIRLTFEHFSMEKLVIRTDARNLPSRRVAESLGFHLDARIRNDMLDPVGGLRDTFIYSLLREEAGRLIASWKDEPFRVSWSDQFIRESRPDQEPTSKSETTSELSRPILLETPRLHIRPPTLDDVEPFFALLERSRASFERWLGSARRIRTIDDARDGIAAAIADAAAGREFSLLAFNRNSGELIGGGRLHTIDPGVPRAEIDWWLDDRQTGQGYATEIGAAQLRFVMDAWRANRAEVWCDVDNQASRRVAARIGFVEEGILRREYSEASDGLVDWAISSVLLTDYARIVSSLPDVRFETD